MQIIQFYRQGIQKVAKMLQDQERTRFVVVCIAEYLSICETRRLLQELKKVSWIIKECIKNVYVQRNACTAAYVSYLLFSVSSYRQSHCCKSINWWLSDLKWNGESCEDFKNLWKRRIWRYDSNIIGCCWKREINFWYLWMV